jgi:inner membrane protein
MGPGGASRRMDPVSQGVLGAAAAQAVARPEQARWAGLLGGLAGMAPDLDALIRSPSDPLLFLEFHRQFTHALSFIPFGALLCTLLAYPLVRRHVSFLRAWVFCLAGYATHGLLDACTSYGTQLLWPFSDLRVAWSNVPIVDPLFTLPLIALTVAAVVRRAPVFARAACTWAIVVLLFGVVQRERAESFATHVAEGRGHIGTTASAKPAFGSLLLWKTFYEYDGRYYVDAARLGFAVRFFPGDSAEKLVPSRDLAWLDPMTQQARDLERFNWFSSGWVAPDPGRKDHVIDVRYSLVPNRIDPLWGLSLDPSAPSDAHAIFSTSRTVSAEHRAEMLRMLFGR